MRSTEKLNTNPERRLANSEVSAPMYSPRTVLFAVIGGLIGLVIGGGLGAEYMFANRDSSLTVLAPPALAISGAIIGVSTGGAISAVLGRVLPE